MDSGPGNGQWVRAHNEQSAKSFLAEQNLEAERRRASRERERRFFRYLGRRARVLFRR